MRWIIALILIGALSLWGIRMWRDRPKSINLTVTAVIETPNGLRTGSSVVQLRAKRNYAFGIVPFVQHEEAGDAIAVDLGDQRPVFILLPTTGTFVSILWASVIEAAPAGISAGWEEDGLTNFWPDLKRERPIVKMQTNEPLELVRFGNLASPSTIETVPNPQIAPGYRLREVTLQATDAPVSRTIQHWLPWVESEVSNVNGQDMKKNFGPGQRYGIGRFRRYGIGRFRQTLPE
jgi:hypothetical protein